MTIVRVVILRGLSTALSVLIVCSSSWVWADDLADEAELHFGLGARAYQRSDFEQALEHFLLSNRLVANKNVVYNIARSFEQIGKFPEAFRYYDLALAAETEPTAIEAIEQALQRIASKVAVVVVESKPPGATIYVDRKDLGPRGTTPRRLGLPAGSYMLFAELPGYRPGQLSTGELATGEQRTLSVALSPILGEIRIGGEAGTTVLVDRLPDGERCVTPCTVSVAPGTHVLHFARSQHEPGETSVEVHADQSVSVEPRLEKLSGSVVVSTDEPNALVEVDGKSRGFTPTVVAVPVGVHQVRVLLAGYKPIERTVTVDAERSSRLDLELISEEQVQGASRRVESVDDTASSVSIVSRQELSALAYPTVAEALRGLPGVYFWDDRGYVGIGMRGLGRLNSYGNRVLVLMDGVPMNDNWLGSAYVGHDLMTDLGDVERIELIRGPGSAVYGTSAFSGVINVISRRATNTGAEAGASTSVDGVARARVRGSATWGNRSSLFASASIGRSEGRDFYFPEYRNLPRKSSNAEPGWARGLDGMRSMTTHGQANSGIFSVHWFWHRYQKKLPSAPFDTWFGDARARQTDERGFVELRAEPRLSSRTNASTRFVLNRYQFRGTYPRQLNRDPSTLGFTDGLETDEFRGHWATLEQRLVHSFSPNWQVTVGGEGAYHFDVQQTARDASGFFFEQRGADQKRYGVLAAYGILDAALGNRVRVSLGGRIDHYTTFGSSINPRIGVVTKPYAMGNTKLTVGRAFRAPSIYELYYNDNGQTQNASPALHPETMIAAEVEHAHRLSPTVVATGAAYVNNVRGLIDTVGAGNSADPLRFVNTRNPLATAGAELGLRRDWRSGWMASIYYGYSRAQLLSDGRFGTFLNFDKEPGFRQVANAPTHSATFKGIAPFLIRGLSLGTRLTFEDRRWDRYEHTGDASQQRTRAAVLWDMVLSAEDEKQRIRAALGVYNIFDWSYRFPVGSEYSLLRTMPGAGRSFLVSLEVRR